MSNGGDTPPPGYSPTGVNTSDGRTIYTGANGDIWIGNSAVPGTSSDAGGLALINGIGFISLLQQGLNYVKSHPVFISFNEIGAAQVTYQASTKTGCINVGLGASLPPTKAVTVGLYNGGNIDRWTDVE